MARPYGILTFATSIFFIRKAHDKDKGKTIYRFSLVQVLKPSYYYRTVSLIMAFHQKVLMVNIEGMYILVVHTPTHTVSYPLSNMLVDHM